MGIIKTLPPRGPPVALGFESGFNFHNKPRLIATIVYADIVVLVLAPHSRTLVPKHMIKVGRVRFADRYKVTTNGPHCGPYALRTASPVPSSACGGRFWSLVE